MRARILAGAVLAVLLPVTAVSAPAVIQAFANFIGSLSTPSAMTGAEVVPLVQNGGTTGLPLSQLQAYLQAKLPITTMLGYTPLNAAGGTMTGNLFAPVLGTRATTARTLSDRVGDAFSVLDFGAKCDGVTNDTAAVQTAVNVSAAFSAQLVGAPRGRTCLVDQLAPVSNLRVRIDGMLKSSGVAKSLIRGAAGVNNVVIEGDGTLDNGFPSTGPAPSASAPVACIDTTGAVNYWTVRGLTLQNCGNFPANMAAYTGTPGAGSHHIYFSYVKAIGAGNRNSFEFADGCDDCWADHLYIDGDLDIGFAFYGNVTNSGITNSRVTNSSLGIAVLSDGSVGTAPNSFPSSNILIQGNELDHNQNEAIEIHGSSTAAAYMHRAIRIIGNDGHNNNLSVATVAGQANKGGETIIECDGCYSSGNYWHDDGSTSATTRPTGGINVYAAAAHFTSVGDNIYNEGVNGVGVGVAVATGAVQPAFYATRIFDSQSAPTMAQGFAGSCGADCTILGAKIDAASVANPFGALTISGLATVDMNGGYPSYVQGDHAYNGNQTVQGVSVLNGGMRLTPKQTGCTNLPTGTVYDNGDHVLRLCP